MKNLQANWYQKNKDHRNKYEWEKTKNDPGFKLYKNCKRRISALINKQDSTKSYLGINFGIIMKWFESQFDEKMNWNNYGSYWHYDHVLAINNFDLTNPEHIYLCFNWKNLTPLSGTENMNKKDKIILTQINKHYDNLEKFILNEKIQDDFVEYIKNYKKYVNTLICETP